MERNHGLKATMILDPRLLHGEIMFSLLFCEILTGNYFDVLVQMYLVNDHD